MKNSITTKNGNYILKGDRTSRKYLIFDNDYKSQIYANLYLKHMHTYGNSFNTIEKAGYELLYFLNYMYEKNINIEEIGLSISINQLFSEYANHIETGKNLLPSTINIRVGIVESFVEYLSQNDYIKTTFKKDYQNLDYSKFSEFHRNRALKRKKCVRKREAKKDFQIPQFNVRDAIVNLYFSDFVCMISNIKRWDADNLIKLRDLCLIDIMLISGLRIGEAIGLKIEDIEFENLKIKVVDRSTNENYAKAKRGNREVPLGEKLGRRLVLLIYKTYELYPIANYIFVNYKGDRCGLAIHKETIEAQFRKYTRGLLKAGYRIDGTIHPHTLRHLCATNLLSNGANLVDVKDVLGHSSVKTTEIYTHILDAKAKQIVKDAEKVLLEDE